MRKKINKKIVTTTIYEKQKFQSLNIYIAQKSNT